MRKFWMLGIFGGAVLSLATPSFSDGQVTTKIKGIEIGGQIRSRYEYRKPDSYSNVTGNANSDSDDTHLLRTRLNAKLDVSEGISGFVELQDAHISGATPVGTDDAGVTVHQGYLQVENIFGSPIDLRRLGRFELNYGSGRLISNLEFANAPRHFDGAILRWNVNEDQTWLDLVYTELVNGDVNTATFPGGLPGRTVTTAQSADDDFDFYFAWLHHQESNWLANAYFLLQRDGLPNTVGELDSPITNRDQLERRTYGAHVEYWNDVFYASAEYDIQSGDRGTDDIESDAFAGVLGWKVGDSANTTLEYEYIYASGDKDPHDGNDNSFQAPFTFGHKFHGAADVVGFRNSIDHNIKLKTSLNEKTRLSLEYHKFSRENRDDGWYNAGLVQLRDGRGEEANGGLAGPNLGGDLGVSGSKDLGQEIDVTLRYDYSENLWFEFLWAHFFAGTFVRETRRTSRDTDYYYLMTKLTF